MRQWPRMHHLLFLAFTLISAAPLGVLALWEGGVAYENELDSVRERHLLVARNLTSTMTRYVKDLKAVFSVTFANGSLVPATGNAGLAALLESLDVAHICVLDPNGAVEAVMPGMGGQVRHPPGEADLAALRALAAKAPDEPTFSNLYHDDNDEPIFYLVKGLPNGRLALGVVTTRYLVSLQQSIAFGDSGHAVITDAKGQVIAHPLKNWVAASRDLSGVPTVEAMMRGETGVGQFFSPAFNGTMIAGYAVVPETGWGVMVPQPLQELRRRANQVNHFAIVIAGVSFALAALLSYLLALWLARPVRRIAATAEAVLTGNEFVAVPTFPGWVASEVRGLGHAFNTMLENLRHTATTTRRALHQAETLNLAKTQFMANMSHELRTPLNGIVGMLELMRLSGLSGTQSSYVEQASRSSQALLRMVNDVLDLSAMEVGTIEIGHAPFRLDAAIEAVRAEYAEIATARGLVMAVSLPDRLHMTLMGDAKHLRQILGHLVDNALKFTENGGVAIRIAATEETPTTIRLRIEVGDTGIGIPAEAQQRIFDAFAMGDDSMTRRHGGSGLGLAIVREICQRMRGELGVQSIVGVGSTFWVSLPFEKQVQEPAAPARAARLPVYPEPPPARARETAPPRAMSATGMEFQNTLRRTGRESVHILLVEDNPANLRVTQTLLQALGCQVTTATNGVEAVDAYRVGTFDMVLMDCQMPDMDGYQATGEIRRIEASTGRRTLIVALTAHAMDGSMDQCLAAGMDDKLSKPMTMAALTGKLMEWLVPARPAT